MYIIINNYKFIVNNYKKQCILIIHGLLNDFEGQGLCAGEVSDAPDRYLSRSCLASETF